MVEDALLGDDKGEACRQIQESVPGDSHEVP